MWNGWKKAAIGLSALLAFVLLELMAFIGGVAVFLGVVMDVDLPFFAVEEGVVEPSSLSMSWSMRRPGSTPAPCPPAPRRDRILEVAGSTDPRAQPLQFMR